MPPHARPIAADRILLGRRADNLCQRQPQLDFPPVPNSCAVTGHRGFYRELGDKYKFKPGDEYRPFGAIYSLVQHTWHTANFRSPDLGFKAPAAAIAAAAELVQQASEKVTRHYRSLGTEEPKGNR